MLAVTKSPDSDRLISWPRVCNSFCPSPPEPDFSDPSMFSQIRCLGQKRSAFFVDIDNMFHNQRLSLSISDLFPLPAISISKLPLHLQQVLRQNLKLDEISNVTVEPSQARTPMGFRWSVDKGHFATRTIISRSLKIFAQKQQASPIHPITNFLPKQQSPCTIAKDRPLFCHIIDDITMFTVDWPDDLVKKFHKILRQLLTTAVYPSREKNPPRPSRCCTTQYSLSVFKSILSQVKFPLNKRNLVH